MAAAGLSLARRQREGQTRRVKLADYDRLTRRVVAAGPPQSHMNSVESSRRTATAGTRAACLSEHLLPPPPRAHCLRSPCAASVAGSRNARGGGVDDGTRVGAPEGRRSLPAAPRRMVSRHRVLPGWSRTRRQPEAGDPPVGPPRTPGKAARPLDGGPSPHQRSASAGELGRAVRSMPELQVSCAATRLARDDALPEVSRGVSSRVGW